MKTLMTLLCTLLIGVLLGTTYNTILAALHITAPVAVTTTGVRVGGSASTVSNANREDSVFGDFWIGDKADRSTGYAEKIVNDKSNNQIEFPMGW